MNTHPNQFRNNSQGSISPDEAIFEPSGQFGDDLRNFRDAVHRAAERATTQTVPIGWLNAAKRRRQAAQRRLVLAWTCAALLCVGALPLLHHSRMAAPMHPAVVQSNADDTALLEQVDTAVSESVPSSLAPLAALDDMSSTTSTNNETPLNKPEKKNVSQ
jgi:hypothetical protein